MIASNVDGWPPHWRVAIGITARTDAPHLPPEPIRAVLADPGSLPDPVTVEGYVTGRALIDGTADGNTIITLDDGTGTMRVLLQRQTPGQYWAAWLGRRIQIDLVNGPYARAYIEEILGAEAARPTHTPTRDCRLAFEVRMGVQLPR